MWCAIYNLLIRFIVYIMLTEISWFQEKNDQLITCY